MPQIIVAPAREGLLVPIPNRHGVFVGMRLARPDDAPGSVVGKSERGVGYVKNDPPYSVVEVSPFITRRILQKELVELSAADVAKLTAPEPVAEVVEAAPVEAEPVAEAEPVPEESTPDTAPRSRRSVR